MPPILDADNLHKTFDGNHAVRGVSFVIEEREIFGLLGPNGAGKTTTIRMLATVLAPDSGHVSIAGNRVDTDAAAVRKLIGVCPQELALYPELSARDNLIFFGRMTGLRAADARERAADMLELLGLADRGRDAVSKFSGGMKRRINIGIALMGRPRLLFLDEPTVGIDPQSRNHIFETVLQLRDEGMSVLYTTHYMEEADRLCDRIGILDHGDMVALGTAADLKRRLGDAPGISLEQVFLELTGHSLRD
jgi:ABC-2 type transport system ATP-binding protein